MAKSKRLPIIKDGDSCTHSLQRRKIRRRIKQAVKDIKNLIDPECYNLPSVKILVNDYDWCDYIIDCRWNKYSFCCDKLSRK